MLRELGYPPDLQDYKGLGLHGNSAVRQFQKDHRLSQTGVLDQQTMEAIKREHEKKRRAEGKTKK